MGVVRVGQDKEWTKCENYELWRVPCCEVCASLQTLPTGTRLLLVILLLFPFFFLFSFPLESEPFVELYCCVGSVGIFFIDIESRVIFPAYWLVFILFRSRSTLHRS